MPSFKVHLALGLAVFVVADALLYGNAFVGPKTPVLLSAAVLGAILPDVDERHTRQFKFALVAASAAVFVFVLGLFKAPDAQALATAAAAAICAAFLFFLAKPRHRGIMHSFWAATAFGAALFLLRGTEAGAVGFLGYASHILIDGV